MTFSWRSYIDALSAMFNECIARHGKVPHWVSQDPDQRSCVDVGASLEGSGGLNYLTSQQRTRRRKRRTSDCFFF